MLITDPQGRTRPSNKQLALEGSCDRRSVARYLAGEKIRGRAGERIRIALLRHGVADPHTVDPVHPGDTSHEVTDGR